MKYYIVILAFVVFACGTTKKSEDSAPVETVQTPTPPQPPVEEVPIHEVLEDQPPYRAANTILTDLVHTKLEVNFNWAQARMNGKATITAKPYFYSSDSLILDAKGMDINSVSLNGKNLTYTYDSLKLRIKLDKVYKRDMQYTVVIDYVAKPNERETGGSAAITSDKGLYFINPTGTEKNKMPQIWTQGETEASSVWFPTIDSPNSKTTQEIFITVDKKYTTLSNGKMISSKNNADGTRTDHWKQDLPHAPYLFMMGIGEFKIVKDSYTRPNGQKMEVNYYVEPEWEPYAKSIFGETPAMIDFFSKKLGVEYPWDKYSQIIVREYVSGAMENTGAVIFGDFAYKTDRELLDANDHSIIAHELFHHWFGDLVTCESWSNLTLNESFANYSQYLWDEHRHGLDEAAYNAEKEMEGYFQSAANSGYHDLVWFHYESREEMFDGHSYNKGGRILHMLRSYLGDEAFFLSLHNFLETYKFQPAEFHQLRLEFEKVSGEDLNWFFNQWYLASGHPDLSVNYEVSPGKVIIKTKQLQDLAEFPLFRLPVDVAVFDNSGKTIHRIDITKKEQEFEIALNGDLKGIVFDDKDMILGTISEKKPFEYYAYQYFNHPSYEARKEGLMQGSRLKTDNQGEQVVLAALSDPFWQIRVLAIEKSGRLSDERKQLGINLIKNLATKDSTSAVRAAALTFLAENLPEEEIKAMLATVFEKELSYTVLSVALQALAVVDTEAAMAQATKMEKDESSQMITGIGKLYSTEGKADKAEFFRNAFRSGKLKGFDEIGMLNSYTYFLINNPEEMERGVEDFRYLSENGGMYTKMFLPQFVTGISNKLENDIANNEAEIAELEKDNNPALVQQLQAENIYLKRVIAGFKTI